MLKHGDVNPLNVHDLRRVAHCPPHFTPFYFDLRCDERKISDWVTTNLDSRFYYGDHVSMDPDRRKNMCKVVAFELASEATYFGLFVDSINQP